jgi:hypothetical protein|eukprot:COSAG06_NODE_2065_length_7685_cov_1179.280649_4_plen_73_part_00
MKLSPDMATRRNQVHTLVCATEDYRQWGKEAIGCSATAASFNLTIFLCGALVPTLIAFSGLYPELPAMKTTL